MTNTRVLVTGASGFVGRWSVGSLLALGADVHTAQRGSLGDEESSAHAVDLHDRDAVAALMRVVERREVDAGRDDPGEMQQCRVMYTRAHAGSC